jgi:hypothetical protein
MHHNTIITVALIGLTASAAAAAERPRPPSRAFVGLNVGYAHSSAEANRVAASGWGAAFRRSAVRNGRRDVEPRRRAGVGNRRLPGARPVPGPIRGAVDRRRPVSLPAGGRPSRGLRRPRIRRGLAPARGADLVRRDDGFDIRDGDGLGGDGGLGVRPGGRSNAELAIIIRPGVRGVVGVAGRRGRGLHVRAIANWRRIPLLSILKVRRP